MRFQRDIEYGGNSGHYGGGNYTNNYKKEPKKPYNKWYEIWFLVVILIILSVISFNSDPGFAGYCMGGAIVLPLIIWYFDN
jgi:hypothetical protein